MFSPHNYAVVVCCYIPLYLCSCVIDLFVSHMYTSSSTAATCRLSFLRKLLLLLLCLQPSLSSLVFISSKCRRRQRRTTLAATNDGRHHHQQQQQHDDNEMKRIIPQALQRVQSSPSTPPLPILKVLDQVCASLVERYVYTQGRVGMIVNECVASERR